MAELFYRIAAIRAVRSAADDAQRILAPHQFGVGVKGGCEHVVHCMQHSLTDLSNDRPQAASRFVFYQLVHQCHVCRL